MVIAFHGFMLPPPPFCALLLYTQSLYHFSQRKAQGFLNFVWKILKPFLFSIASLPLAECDRENMHIIWAHLRFYDPLLLPIA